MSDDNDANEQETYEQADPGGPWHRNKTVRFTITAKDVTFQTERKGTYAPPPAMDSHSDTVTVVSGELTGTLITEQDGENDYYSEDDKEDDEAWKEQVLDGLKQLLAVAAQIMGKAKAAPSPFETR